MIHLYFLMDSGLVGKSAEPSRDLRGFSSLVIG